MQIVQPEGSLSSKLAIIGEAPGAEEDRVGRPFMGASGQLQDGILSSCGWLRSRCYIDNVVPVRPPANDISVYIEFHERKEPTVTAEFLAYRDQLRERLSRFEGNIIVAVGATAMYALTGYYDKITKRRGSIYPCTLVPGKKVLVTVHPAAVLREYDFIYPYTHDFRRAIEESAFPEIRSPQRTIHLAPAYQDAMGYLEGLHGQVGFDIEVVNNEVSCLAFAQSPNDIMCIPFYSHGHNFYSTDEEALLWQQIALVLLNPKISKVLQNGFFDCAFLFSKYGIIVNNIEDTMIGQAIIAPNLPKGLDFITSIYTKEPYYKDEGKKYFKLFTDEESFWKYNAKDAAVTLEAFGPIYADVKALGNEAVYRRHVRLIHPLIFMSEHGIPMDQDGLKKKSEEAGRELARLQAELDLLTGEPLNINSPKQVQTYFYVTKKARPYTNRKTGSVTSDDDALTRLAIKGFKEAELILKMRELSKAKSTYYDIRLVSGRLKCAFNPVGAADTGRLSSGKTIFDEGGNMQNQPEDMKEMMLAD